MKKNIKRVVIAIGVLFVLGIAGCFYSVTRPPYVEWDEHDPQLHGQELIFTEPIVYEFIDPIEHYGTKQVKINLVLSNRKNAKNDLKHNFSLKTKDVKKDMRFIITQSFWLRHNWWESAFANTSRSLVLQDENGQRVTSSFYRLRESNQPELFKLKDKGYIK